MEAHTNGRHDKHQQDHDYHVESEHCGRCRDDAANNYERLRHIDPEYAEQWRDRYQRWFDDRWLDKRWHGDHEDSDQP